MKVRVIKSFRDKYTKKVYKADDIIEVSEERFDEILSVDKLVEKVTEVTEPKKAAKKKKSE